MKVTIRRKRRTQNQIAHRKLSGIISLLGVGTSILQAQSRADMLAVQIREKEKRLELLEQDIAARSNAVVLGDINIEKKKLELEVLRRKVGTPDDFAPEMTRWEKG